MTKQDIYRDLKPHYLSHESIAREAYAIWENEGCPDGESPVNPNYPDGLKNKNWHWSWATSKLEMLLEMDSCIFWVASNYGKDWKSKTELSNLQTS